MGWELLGKGVNEVELLQGIVDGLAVDFVGIIVVFLGTTLHQRRSSEENESKGKGKTHQGT